MHDIALTKKWANAFQILYHPLPTHFSGNIVVAIFFSICNLKKQRKKDSEYLGIRED
jgi:hypothetical protein